VYCMMHKCIIVKTGEEKIGEVHVGKKHKWNEKMGKFLSDKYCWSWWAPKLGGPKGFSIISLMDKTDLETLSMCNSVNLQVFAEDWSTPSIITTITTHRHSQKY